MPPKQKLTKKQIEEQKREAARLQKQKEQQEAEAERERLAEQARKREKQRKKMLEEERIRIVQERQKKYPELEQRLRMQKKSLQNLRQSENWEKFTTQHYKNYSIEGTNLSTFMNIFMNAKHKNAKHTLDLCEQSEIYITKLEEKLLQYRSESLKAEEEECKKNIKILWGEELRKLEQIMIDYANSAQDIQEKNVEEAKKKNESNTGPKTIKPVDSVANSTPNFKIGMYIHTYSTKNYNKFAPIGIKQFGFNSDMPPKWSSNLAYVKFQWTNFNLYAPETKQEFRIVGGVYNIEFYDLPPATKKASTISIRKKFKGNEILNRFKLQPSVIKQSFKVMYEIPKYIFMAPYKNGNRADLKIAQFDLATEKWNILPSDSIMEYMENENRVVCKVPRPQPLAFVESRCADYPYVAWQLRTVEPGKVLLDFELKRFLNMGQEQIPLMIQFEIGPNVVKLEMDQKYDQLNDLCNAYYTPEAILNQLSKRGIHLLPVDEDYQFAKITKKDELAERLAIRDIAYAVQSFTVRSQVNDGSQIKVKIRENLDYESIFLQDQEKDWKKIRWGDSDKCWIEDRGIQQRHMDLQTLLEAHEISEKECIDRIKYDKSYLLRKTIMKMLALTRVLAFTTADPAVSSKLVEHLKKKIIVC